MCSAAQGPESFPLGRLASSLLLPAGYPRGCIHQRRPALPDGAAERGADGGGGGRGLGRRGRGERGHKRKKKEKEQRPHLSVSGLREKGHWISRSTLVSWARLHILL